MPSVDLSRLVTRSEGSRIRVAIYIHPTHTIAEMAAANYWNDAWAGLPANTFVDILSVADGVRATGYVVSSSKLAGVVVSLQRDTMAFAALAGAVDAQAAARVIKAWYPVYNFVATAQVTGTTSETVLATASMAANLLGTKGRARAWSLWDVNNSVNAKTARVRIGAAGAGTGGTIVESASMTSLASWRAFTEIVNMGATNVQSAGPAGGTPTAFNAQTQTVAAAAIDTTAPWEIAFTGALASAAGGEYCKLVTAFVEVYYDP